MKKVINGKLYDTDTAKRVGFRDNGHYPDDAGYYSEGLYQKRTGEYFLRGRGGPNSRYGVWHGNSGDWGEQIMPFSLSDAQEWAEKNLDGETYIEIFGEIEEDDSKVTISLSLPQVIAARLKEKRAETGKTVSTLVEEALREKHSW